MKNFTFLYLIYILYLISPSHSAFDLEIPSASSTHIVPHRKENPYSDLRLHPAKGTTAGIKEKTVTCTHPYFGRIFKFDYPELIEMTCSYPAAPFDVFSVTQGMHPYTFKLGGEVRKFRMTAGVREHLYSKPFLTISGELHQINLHLRFTPKYFNKYCSEFNILLN